MIFLLTIWLHFVHFNRFQFYWKFGFTPWIQFCWKIGFMVKITSGKINMLTRFLNFCVKCNFRVLKQQSNLSILGCKKVNMCFFVGKVASSFETNFVGNLASLVICHSEMETRWRDFVFSLTTNFARK